MDKVRNKGVVSKDRRPVCFDFCLPLSFLPVLLYFYFLFLLFYKRYL